MSARTVLFKRAKLMPPDNGIRAVNRSKAEFKVEILITSRGLPRWDPNGVLRV